MAKYYFTFGANYLIVNAQDRDTAIDVYQSYSKNEKAFSFSDMILNEEEWKEWGLWAYGDKAPVVNLYHYSDRKEVKTSIGEIVVDVVDDKNYPGVWISFRPKGSTTEVGIALAEVCEDEGKFHLRPYVSKRTHNYDKDGQLVKGKISFDAPFDDCSFTLEDILSEEEMYD